MIRFFLRLFGLVCLAAAFILVIIDGTRSIADKTLRLTSVRGLWDTFNAASLQSLRPLIENSLGTWAWDPVFSGFLTAPSAAVLGVTGIVLIVLGRKKRPLIGYAR